MLMGLRYRVKLLIEVTFVLNSSLSFKRTILSLNLLSSDVFYFYWVVVKWDYEELDHIWPVLVPIP